ncbi:MAG: dipicolinate synthase subunit DpsA [Defluviitaleaceae bacterium]|nr:dipicolinate synthase subunit DpsA [Defluviitaleaceae bacterium]
MTTRSFAIIGGDKRSIALAEILFRQKHRVKMYGFANYERETPMQCKNLYETISEAEYIIGPIPCSHNGGALNAPFNNGPILTEDLFRLIKPTQTFLAGYIKPEVHALADKYSINAVDMLCREELLVLNAIPTAEGAIKIAIEETDITLHGSNILILGYGRIGSVLGSMLRGMGARVSTVVRSGSKAALASSGGHIPIMYGEMDACLPEADIIINTVPEILLDRRNMKHIRKDTLIIDLASPPYGVDVTASRDFGLKALFTNSLPGKIAPVTTAGYILETINNIIAEDSGGLLPGTSKTPKLKGGRQS